jgi:hypothetical protein
MQTVYLLTLDDMEFLKKNLTEIQTILDVEGAIPESYAKSALRQNLDNIKIVLKERRPYI